LTERDNVPTGALCWAAMDGPERAVSGAIARNLRALRTGHGWSLDALSQRSGVSKGMLVQIEQGASNPSIGTLTRICEALDVTLAQLVDLGELPAVRLVRAREAVTLWHDDAGSRADLLLGMERREHIELWTWRLGAGGAFRAEAHAPGTREMLHVTEGTLHLEVGGAAHDLEPGDSVLFSADRAHAYANRGPGEARFQMVVVMAPAAGD
jgi:transcriptional regulator with XRE-family HTH domain